MSAVGVFGHSYGGFTAAETMYQDRRFDAGVNLDGRDERRRDRYARRFEWWPRGSVHGREAEKETEAGEEIKERPRRTGEPPRMTGSAVASCHPRMTLSRQPRLGG
ncbi:hypothetical protein AB0I60_14065 [Actinosynnema sp. NPDC050436]|uniref:alpha/beta hydrolase n=1 Tax=Actinosynnema sp. NPDC050436 TaxID=3155659 RepID=UPI0033FB50B8